MAVPHAFGDTKPAVITPTAVRNPGASTRPDGLRERLTLRWSNEIRIAVPILVFIDRGCRLETNTDGSALVDIRCIRQRPPAS